MEVTDIATGHFVFAPVTGKSVSFAALGRAIEKAGYRIEKATIAVRGTLTAERHLKTPAGQVFHLTAADAARTRDLARLPPGAPVSARGRWKTAEGTEVVEVAELAAAAENSR
jgi:hypothetical protein